MLRPPLRPPSPPAPQSGNQAHCNGSVEGAINRLLSSAADTADEHSFAGPRSPAKRGNGGRGGKGPGPVTVFVAADMVGRIIGKGGVVINQIRTSTGADVRIVDGEHDEAGRTLTIRGSQQQVAAVCLTWYLPICSIMTPPPRRGFMRDVTDRVPRCAKNNNNNKQIARVPAPVGARSCTALGFIIQPPLPLSLPFGRRLILDVLLLLLSLLSLLLLLSLLCYF